MELVILAMFSFCYQVYVELEAIGAASAESRVRRILAVSSVILWFKLMIDLLYLTIGSRLACVCQVMDACGRLQSMRQG